VHLYPTRLGEIITVATAGPAPDDATLTARAAAIQEKFGFRLRLPELLAQRNDKASTGQTAELLTDDFAPVNLYDTMGDKRKKK